MRKCARLLWFAVVLSVTLGFLNYPRSWWQELIAQTAPLWCMLFVVVVALELARFRRSPISIVAVCICALQVVCIVKVVRVLAPYGYAPQRSRPGIEYSNPIRVLFFDTSARPMSSDSKSFEALLRAEHPDLVVVTRDSDVPVLDRSDTEYPFVLASSLDSGRKVEVFSKTPISSSPRTEYGYGALPGVLGGFQTSDGTHFQVGAFDALPSKSQEYFNMSRLTSRRLASALKFSTEPRIVVGAFRASVTSQVVDMYVDQLKLRSVFFDSGAVMLLRLVARSIPFNRNLNVFTARTVDVFDVREEVSERPTYGAIIFTARIPRT